MKTLIKNGRVVTAVDDYHADIFIDGDTVTTIGKSLEMWKPMRADAAAKFGLSLLMNRLILTVSLLLLVAAANFAQNSTGANVDRFVKAAMARQKIPGVSLAVVRNAKPLVVKGYGFANLEHKITVKPGTIFQSGSVGKQFTAAAIMLLVEDGKLGLDDKISKYLADVPESWKGITVRHLLTHTNGLASYPEEFDFLREYTEDELWRQITQVTPAFQPGDRWRYSNLGYVTLGILIRKVTGRFYGDYLKQRIFIPLGMRTARVITEEEIVPNRSAGYRLIKGQIKNQEWVSPSINTTADGSLYLSVLDMLKWDAALNGSTLLRNESRILLWTPVTLSDGTTHPYGLGWEINTVNGRRLIEHGGTWQGFEAHISRYPDENLSVIIFANLRGAQLRKMAHQIASIINPNLKAKAVDDKDIGLTNEHRRLLQEMIDGTADRRLFTPAAVEAIFPLVERARDQMKQFGAIQSIELLDRKTLGSSQTNVYRILFANMKALYTVILKENMITSMDLKPE